MDDAHMPYHWMIHIGWCGIRISKCIFQMEKEAPWLFWNKNRKEPSSGVARNDLDDSVTLSFNSAALGNPLMRAASDGPDRQSHIHQKNAGPLRDRRLNESFPTWRN